MRSILTVSLLIGNSDNKLIQEDWSNFILDVKDKINYYCGDSYFCGGSSFDSIYQNACFVFDIEKSELEKLKKDIKEIREYYKQDSVALVIGHTHFI